MELAPEDTLLRTRLIDVLILSPSPSFDLIADIGVFNRKHPSHKITRDEVRAKGKECVGLPGALDG